MVDAFLGGAEAPQRKQCDQAEFTSMEDLKVVLRGSFEGSLLLCGAINLLCADCLICLLSERSHCRLMVAIVCVGGLKNLG